MPEKKLQFIIRKLIRIGYNLPILHSLYSFWAKINKFIFDRLNIGKVEKVAPEIGMNKLLTLKSEFSLIH